MSSAKNTNKMRIDWEGTRYARMAIDNYFIMKDIFQKAIDEDCEEYRDLENKIKDCLILIVVFSEMSAEAIINDYGASCLGDQVFYSNFDRLPVYSKFMLIKSLIFNVKEDYCSKLKDLAKKRNQYVHPKTKESEISFDDYYMIDDENQYKRLCLKKMKETVTEARDFLKVIFELTTFLDNMDKQAKYTMSVFFPYIFEGDRDERDQIKIEVYKDLGIQLKFYP